MSNTPLEVLFRVATNPRFGLGHINRLAALRSFFPGKCTWFIDPIGRNALQSKIPKSDQIFVEETDAGIDKLLNFSASVIEPVIVFDTYQISVKKISLLRAKIFVFDDTADTTHPRNLNIINCFPTKSKASNYLSGPQYMPLDVKNRTQPKILYPLRNELVNCLVSFGGVDSTNSTGFVLSGILSDRYLRSIVTPVVVLGPNFSAVDEITPLLHKFKSATLLRNVSNLMSPKIKCHIAVGSPGVSHSERLYSGIASVLVAQNEMHIDLSRRWEKEGLAIFSERSCEGLVGSIRSLISEDFKVAREIAIRGQKMVDGNGARRILAKINERI